MKKHSFLLASFALLCGACSSTTPVMTQTSPAAPASLRSPASMDWEKEMSDEAMKESTVKWYETKIKEAQSTTAAAHVDIANKIAQAKLKGGTCSGDFYYTDLVDHYLAALNGNSKAKFDSAVHKLLSQNMVYKVATILAKKDMYSSFNSNYLDSTYALQDLKMEDLDNVYFETMAAGAYGSWANVVLKKDGTAKFNNLKMDDEGMTSWESHEGSWQMKFYDSKESKTGTAKNVWGERRGLVIYLTKIINGKEHTDAYRVRFRNNEYRLETKAEDFSKEEYIRPSYVSSITGECDA
jgi:hypothetical protein